MLVDPSGQLGGGNRLATDLLRQHIDSIGEISRRMGMVIVFLMSDLIIFTIIIHFSQTDNEEESSEGMTDGRQSTSAKSDQHMSAITDKLKKSLTQANIAQLLEKLLVSQKQQQQKEINSKTVDDEGKTSQAKHPMATAKAAASSEETIKTNVTTTKPKAFDLKMASEDKKDTEAINNNKGNKAKAKKKASVATTPVTTTGKKKTTDKRPQKQSNSVTTTKSKNNGHNKNIKAKIYEKEIDLLLQKIEKLEKQKKVEVKAPTSVEKPITPDVAEKIKQFMNIETDDANKKDAAPTAPGSPEEWQQQVAGAMPPMPPPPHFAMPFMPFMPPMPPMQQFEPPQPEGDAQQGYPMQSPAEQVDPRSRGPMEQVAPPPPQQLQQDYMQQQATGAQPQHALYSVGGNQETSSIPQYGQAQDYNPAETYQQQPPQLQSQQQQPQQQPQQPVPGEYQQMPVASAGYQQQAPSAQTYPNTYNYVEPQEQSKKSIFRRKFKLSNILNSVMPKSRKKKEEEERKMAAAMAAAAAQQQQSSQAIDGRRYPAHQGSDQMAQESQNYNYVDRGQYMQYEKPGMQLSLGAGPMGGGSQLKVSPMGILKTLVLPLLPKPRMNLNGKVVFGVVLENGVGFGKKPKTVFQHYSTGRLRR